MPSATNEPIEHPPERWIVITNENLRRSTNVKFPVADRLPVLHLIQRHRCYATQSGSSLPQRLIWIIREFKVRPALTNRDAALLPCYTVPAPSRLGSSPQHTQSLGMVKEQGQVGCLPFIPCATFESKRKLDYTSHSNDSKRIGICQSSFFNRVSRAALVN